MELCLAPGGPSLGALNTGSIHALAFSHDGKFLANSGQDETVRVWKTDTLENLQVLRPGLTYVLAWSPDGRLLATNGPSGRVQLWQKENGQRLAVVLPGSDGRGLAVNTTGHYHSHAEKAPRSGLPCPDPGRPKNPDPGRIHPGLRLEKRPDSGLVAEPVR